MTAREALGQQSRATVRACTEIKVFFSQDQALRNLAAVPFRPSLHINHVFPCSFGNGEGRDENFRVRIALAPSKNKIRQVAVAGCYCFLTIFTWGLSPYGRTRARAQVVATFRSRRWKAARQRKATGTKGNLTYRRTISPFTSASRAIWSGTFPSCLEPKARSVAVSCVVFRLFNLEARCDGP